MTASKMAPIKKSPLKPQLRVIQPPKIKNRESVSNKHPISEGICGNCSSKECDSCGKTTDDNLSSLKLNDLTKIDLALSMFEEGSELELTENKEVKVLNQRIIAPLITHQTVTVLPNQSVPGNEQIRNDKIRSDVVSDIGEKKKKEREKQRERFEHTKGTPHREIPVQKEIVKQEIKREAETKYNVVRNVDHSTNQVSKNQIQIPIINNRSCGDSSTVTVENDIQIERTPKEKQQKNEGFRQHKEPRKIRRTFLEQIRSRVKHSPKTNLGKEIRKVVNTKQQKTEKKKTKNKKERVKEKQTSTFISKMEKKKKKLKMRFSRGLKKLEEKIRRKLKKKKTKKEEMKEETKNKKKEDKKTKKKNTVMKKLEKFLVKLGIPKSVVKKLFDIKTLKSFKKMKETIKKLDKKTKEKLKKILNSKENCGKLLLILLGVFKKDGKEINIDEIKKILNKMKEILSDEKKEN